MDKKGVYHWGLGKQDSEGTTLCPFWCETKISNLDLGEPIPPLFLAEHAMATGHIVWSWAEQQLEIRLFYCFYQDLVDLIEWMFLHLDTLHSKWWIYNIFTI